MFDIETYAFRPQALVEAERKGSAALAKQCTSALRALHTTSPPHRAPDYFAAASEGAVRRSAPETVEPILLNSEARDLELGAEGRNSALELGAEGRNSALPTGIASRFYDSLDLGDAWVRHVSLEGAFGRPADARRTERKSYGMEEQVKQVVAPPRYEPRPDSRAETPAFSDAPSDGLRGDPDALTREASGDDVTGVDSRSRRTSRRASAGGMSMSENGIDADGPEQGRPNALEALLNDFDVDNASADGESHRRFSRRASGTADSAGMRGSGTADSAGMKKTALSLEDLAVLAEPYSPPRSDGGASEGNGEPYEVRFGQATSLMEFLCRRRDS